MTAIFVLSALWIYVVMIAFTAYLLNDKIKPTKRAAFVAWSVFWIIFWPTVFLLALSDTMRGKSIVR